MREMHIDSNGNFKERILHYADKVVTDMRFVVDKHGGLKTLEIKMADVVLLSGTQQPSRVGYESDWFAVPIYIMSDEYFKG